MAIGSDEIAPKSGSDLPMAIITAQEMTVVCLSLDTLEKQQNFLKKALKWASNRKSSFREREVIKTQLAYLATCD
jgi:hypothetical protein